MSEYRETISMDSAALPEPEPVITMAELVARIDWNLPAPNLRTTGPALPVTGSTLSLPSSGMEAPSLFQDPTVSTLLSSQLITVPVSQEKSTVDRLKALASGGSVDEILSYSRTLAVARQERAILGSLEILRQACLRSGFNEVVIREGIVTAMEAGTTRRADIEIEKAPRGQVAVNFDMHGFHGDACLDRADAIAAHAAELGLKLETRNRLPKTDANVAEGRRLPRRSHAGQG